MLYSGMTMQILDTSRELLVDGDALTKWTRSTPPIREHAGRLCRYERRVGLVAYGPSGRPVDYGQ